MNRMNDDEYRMFGQMKAVIASTPDKDRHTLMEGLLSKYFAGGMSLPERFCVGKIAETAYNSVREEEARFGRTKPHGKTATILSVVIGALILVWVGLRIKETSNSTYSIAGRYPVERIDMTPSACIIRPAQGATLASIFNFQAFSGFKPDGTQMKGDDVDLLRLPAIEKFGASFDAYSTRFGRLEVGTTAGELANGSSYRDELLYLYPHTSDLSIFLNRTVLNQLPPITDKQIGIFNGTGEAEIIIEVKSGQITFVEWKWG